METVDLWLRWNTGTTIHARMIEILIDRTNPLGNRFVNYMVQIRNSFSSCYPSYLCWKITFSSFDMSGVNIFLINSDNLVTPMAPYIFSGKLSKFSLLPECWYKKQFVFWHFQSILRDNIFYFRSFSIFWNISGHSFLICDINVRSLLYQVNNHKMWLCP